MKDERVVLEWGDCCRMTKSAIWLRRNKGYLGQKVEKTLFGTSPMLALVVESRKLKSGTAGR